MIKVEHLQKIYSQDKINGTHAIDDISFTFPDKGMIFIVGKSGSGKSTLLNILGGLDDFDSGSVIVDGNNLGKMKHNDFNKYRSGYVSFIFQDHFLIDDLKVKDNVMLSLNIINKNDIDLVDETLKKVGLEEKLESFPQELSGGERQRVAVARAIIKKPKLILCDEPTGNLDDNTTKNIFDLLKELSEDRLVVVVSHDMESARIYADRIIELFAGKIIKDEVKNPNYSDKIQFDDHNIIIPCDKVLNNDDILTINSNLNNKSLIKLSDKQYKEYQNYNYKERNIKLEKNKFYRGRTKYISKIFIKRRLNKMLIISCIVSLIIACFSVFLSLLSFDGNKEIINKLKKSNASEIIFRNNCYVTGNEETSLKYQGKLYSLLPEDYDYFYNGNYNGNIYKIYNYEVAYSASSGMRNETYARFETNLANFYMKESYGTLCCNKEYLEKKFGNIEVIKGDINNKGVIITDYLADSILMHNLYRNSYDELVGKYYVNSSKNDFVLISAIIKTDYMEHFSDILEKIDEKEKRKVDVTKLLTSDEFDAFAKEIEMKYGLAYCFSSDFLGEYINSDSIGYIPIRYSHMEYEGTDYYLSQTFSFCKTSASLNHNEVIGNMRYINQIFGTDYTNDTLNEFKPMKVKLKKYYDYSLYMRNDVIDEVELTIVSLVNDNSNQDMFCRPDDYELFKNVSVINYGLLFDNVKDALTLLEKKPFNNFYVEDSNVKAINLIAKYVSVFRKLSILLSSILAVTGLILLIFYEVSNISSMKKEIGILKACGTAQRTISKVFIMQQIIVSIMVLLLSLILSYLLIETANSLMISSIEKYAKVFINELTIVKFIPVKIITILILTVIIIMASCIIPILLLVKVKPMNIIKAKE